MHMFRSRKKPDKCPQCGQWRISDILYGIDIIKEAVEICKLRLFLKLVAQVDKAKDLEPLPDTDFNIPAGNTLVGFTTLNDVKQTLEGRLGLYENEVNRIVESAETVDRAFQRFQEMQSLQKIDAREFAPHGL